MQLIYRTIYRYYDFFLCCDVKWINIHFYWNFYSAEFMDINLSIHHEVDLIMY